SEKSPAYEQYKTYRPETISVNTFRERQTWKVDEKSNTLFDNTQHDEKHAKPLSLSTFRFRKGHITEAARIKHRNYRFAGLGFAMNEHLPDHIEDIRDQVLSTQLMPDPKIALRNKRKRNQEQDENIEDQKPKKKKRRFNKDPNKHESSSINELPPTAASHANSTNQPDANVAISADENEEEAATDTDQKKIKVARGTA